MIFIAEIAKGSFIERNWLRMHRVGGEFQGIYFHKAYHHFVSDPLNEEDLGRVQGHPWIKLSVMSAANPFKDLISEQLQENSKKEIDIFNGLENLGLPVTDYDKAEENKDLSEKEIPAKRVGRPRKEI